MCGRFYVEKDDISSEELAEAIEQIQRKIKDQGLKTQDIKTSGEIYPSNIVPVKTASGLNMMRWGFTKTWGDKPGLGINARSDGILADKTMYAKAARTNRCLIPASYYYEWQPQGVLKIKYRIRPGGRDPIYMAGVWRVEHGLPYPVFSIVTCDAAPGIRCIHDRMPVILSKDAHAAWIAPNAPIDAVLASALTDMVAVPDEPVQTRMF